MSGPLWPKDLVQNYVPKTGECFQCGIREGSAKLEVCVWVKADGTRVEHPKMRMQCMDLEECDRRIHENFVKACIVGDGPVKVRI